MNVIIVGAGIGGLTTAIALQKANINVSVYERSPEIKGVGAGLSLWANALHIYDALGLGDSLRGHGKANLDGGIRDWRGSKLVGSNSAQVDYEIEVIHRAELQDLLLNAYTGDLHLGYSAVRYENQADGVRVYFADGTHADADLLIASDGIHSPIRQQMHPNTPPKYAGYTAWRGVVPFPHAQVGAMWGESWGHGQRFGITPLRDERVYWFATGNEPAGQTYTSDENKAILLERFADWHAPIKHLLEATDANDILHNDIYHIDPLPFWVDGRAVLLGDSAHAMTPNMGQGACQAIEDAYALPYYLQTRPDIRTALQSYDRIRRPRAELVMKQSERIGQAGQLESRALVWLRDMAIRLTPQSITERTINTIVGYDVREELA